MHGCAYKHALLQAPYTHMHDTHVHTLSSVSFYAVHLLGCQMSDWKSTFLQTLKAAHTEYPSTNIPWNLVLAFCFFSPHFLMCCNPRMAMLASIWPAIWVLSGSLAFSLYPCVLHLWAHIAFSFPSLPHMLFFILLVSQALVLFNPPSVLLLSDLSSSLYIFCSTF